MCWKNAQPAKSPFFIGYPRTFFTHPPFFLKVWLHMGKSIVFYVLVRGKKLCQNWLIFGGFKCGKDSTKHTFYWIFLVSKYESFGFDEYNHWHSLKVLNEVQCWNKFVGKKKERKKERGENGSVKYCGKAVKKKNIKNTVTAVSNVEWTEAAKHTHTHTHRRTREQAMTASQTWTTHSVTQKREEEEKFLPINK